MNKICSPTTFYSNIKSHVVATFNPIDAEMKLFVNASLSVSSKLTTRVPGRGTNDLLYLSSDLIEFRIWGGYFSQSTLYSHYTNGPNANIGK